MPVWKRESTNKGYFLDWSDNTINLGWYISVLATENNLLVSSGQDATNNTKELYYAIKAFNRLDGKAEPYWRKYYHKLSNRTGTEVVGGIDEPNGFFIMDDVRNNFLSQAYNS